MSLSKARARLLGRLQRNKTRAREGAFLGEGVRCVAELVHGGAQIRFVVAAPRLERTAGGLELLQEIGRRGIELIAVDDATLDATAATESPQGVMAVCEEPTSPPSGARRILVADGVQDPGNLGTLIRSAAAFGIDVVFAVEGTVDPYNPKVVRSSAGAVARVPVRTGRWSDLVADLAARDIPILAAASDGAPVAPRGRDAWALVVGNEARGVRAEVVAAAATAVAVPMSGDIDSLNVGVAGSILMYALTQKQMEGEDGE